MSAENGEHRVKLKLKLTAPLVQREAAHQGPEPVALGPIPDRPLLIGARGGAALKDLLSTAPNPEEAIREFQASYGLSFAATTGAKRGRGSTPEQAEAVPPVAAAPKFSSAEQLLDLLRVGRSGVYQSLLERLMQEMLLRIEELSQEELQRLLEATFPYIEFRELRKIPIAILARQEDTPEVYLRELTENRRILHELPVHVRRKIMHVDKQELQYFVEQCTQEYIEEKLEWYAKHPGQPLSTKATSANHSTSSHHRSTGGTSALAGTNGNDLWNVTSHMPSPSSQHSHNPWFTAPEERRRQSAALATLTEMIGDSETLYLSTIDILKDYVIAASIPGSTNTSAKEYVDYVPFLGALRNDLANLQRDRTTSLLRTDPLHKFIWFLDRAVKNQNALDISQLHELLAFVKKIRLGDLPLNKKFKKFESQEEEENFEIVLGPPPVDQLLLVLEKIGKADARMIFAEPVPDDVPNYKEIIKEPMDLSTMRKKAKKGKYKTLDMFTDDFNLMIKNCMKFNPDTTIFYKEGKRVGKRGLEIIEKNAVSLRGEPQRIRAKKRKKSGTAEAMTMLTSTGIVTLKDFGDVDQTGMVLEGLCEEVLADIAMILSDPSVKQTLCESLMKTLALCSQRSELPTDNVVCRGLVQLIQIGNPASVRRMLRKKEYILRSPQVVTMRVALPLLLRTMLTSHIGLTGSASSRREAIKGGLGSDNSLWESVLRTSLATRSLMKAFILQCLKENRPEYGVNHLHHLVAVEGEGFFRDRVFLHAVVELVLYHIKAIPLHVQDQSALEAMRNSSIWRHIVDGFLVAQLSVKTRDEHNQQGRLLEYFDGDESPEDVQMVGVNPRTVKSFPVAVFHEKVAMLLLSVIQHMKKAGAKVEEDGVACYLRQTLLLLRRLCSSLSEFELLWNSSVFEVCHEFYEQLLVDCPSVRALIFSADVEAEPEPIKPTANSTSATSNSGELDDKSPAQSAVATATVDEHGEDLEAGEIDEEMET